MNPLHNRGIYFCHCRVGFTKGELERFCLVSMFKDWEKLEVALRMVIFSKGQKSEAADASADEGPL